MTYYYLIFDAYGKTDTGGVVIWSLNPSTAAPGTVINGTAIALDPVASDNKIWINDVMVPATSVGTVSFSFTVPANAVSGFLVLENSFGSSNPVYFTVYEGSSTYANISSVAVSSANTVFVSDTGTAGTSDRVFKINSDETHTQVGALNEATGMAVDSSNSVYYGNALNDAVNNSGTIEKTDFFGTELFHGRGGCISPFTASWVFGIGVDKDYSGGTPRIYQWDRANNSVRHVPSGGSCGTSPVLISGFTGLAGLPQGIAANNNLSSSHFHNLTVTTGNPQVREYSSSYSLLKTYTTSNLNLSQPSQIAHVSQPAERLLITNKSGNNVVMLNQTTDKYLTLDWPLTSPRAIGIDPVSTTRADTVVGEQFRMKRFPLAFHTVYVQVFRETGSQADQNEIMLWFNRARQYFMRCRVNLVLRTITEFTDAALRDIDANDPQSDPYSFTSEELSLFSMRSSTATDLNVYVVRFIIDPDTQTQEVLGYAVVEDSFSNVTDISNSGIVIAGGRLEHPNNRGQVLTTLAHEIGHALIYKPAWSFSEHMNLGGTNYVVNDKNLMIRGKDAKSTDLDADQCNNLGGNIASIDFRSDP
ncbi:MAG: hypothetical protein LC778_16870 [Acidobacteria bacterium]|nr:hypothetical protein [Acidobacteriota bacterium]